MWHETWNMWHVTWDMWQVTCDTWHVTCDLWCGVDILFKFYLPSFNGLGETVFWRYFHDGSLTESLNYDGVCKKAAATSGLLNIIMPPKTQVNTWRKRKIIWGLWYWGNSLGKKSSSSLYIIHIAWTPFCLWTPPRNFFPSFKQAKGLQKLWCGLIPSPLGICPNSRQTISYK